MQNVRASVDIGTAGDVSKTAELKDIKEQLMLYAKENQRLVNELRELRHSNINILNGINGFIELEDWDGLKEYFDDILEKIRNVSDISLSSIEKVLNPLLKDILYTGFKNALDIDIDVKVIVDDSIFIDNNQISEPDLCKVIGEFLNNAIEAASQAVSKKVSIYILNNEKSISIIIESTFKEKPNMPLKKSGEQSTGIILSKYPNVLNNTFIQHQILVQELQILR